MSNVIFDTKNSLVLSLHLRQPRGTILCPAQILTVQQFHLTLCAQHKLSQCSNKKKEMNDLKRQAGNVALGGHHDITLDCHCSQKYHSRIGTEKHCHHYLPI